MRPHVELIAHQDLIWHEAELPEAIGEARQRNLSYDEETGAASTLVEFISRWTRPGGHHDADTEWFVLRGKVSVGDRGLCEHGYMRAPAGLRVPPMSADAGTVVLVVREYGDAGFTLSELDRYGFIAPGGHDASGEPGQLTLVEPDALEWTVPPWEPEKDPSGLEVKILYRNPSPPGEPQHGHLACLWRAPVGWRNDATIHQAVFEEAFGLEGTLTYNFGELSAGRYYHRPRLVKYSELAQAGTEPALVFLRLGGDAPRWVTRGSVHRVQGEAVNYDPGDPLQAPLPAGIAVRSTRAGPAPVPEPAPPAGGEPPTASATVANNLRSPVTQEV